MTDADLADLYATVRDNCASPLVKAMVDMIQRTHHADRELLTLARHHAEITADLYGHRVYGDNTQHSMRATDLRSVS